MLYKMAYLDFRKKVFCVFADTPTFLFGALSNQPFCDQHNLIRTVLRQQKQGFYKIHRLCSGSAEELCQIHRSRLDVRHRRLSLPQDSQ